VGRFCIYLLNYITSLITYLLTYGGKKQPKFGALRFRRPCIEHHAFARYSLLLSPLLRHLHIVSIIAIHFHISPFLLPSPEHCRVRTRRISSRTSIESEHMTCGPHRPFPSSCASLACKMITSLPPILIHHALHSITTKAQHLLAFNTFHQAYATGCRMNRVGI